MSKLFFRFMRGELNGYYLDSMNAAFNKAFSDRHDFLGKFSRMVFKTPSQVSGGEEPVTSGILHGIGTFAGVFPPWVSQDSLAGSIRFTQSFKQQQNEMSDRGLFKMDTESFEFTPPSYNTNWFQSQGKGRNEYATTDKRTSLVENGAALLGFFQEGDKVIRDDGTVDTSLLITFSGSESSQYEQAERYFSGIGKAYSPFYGIKYLYLAEHSPIVASTGDDVFLELIKAMQYIRYNGANIASLCHFAEVLCPDYLFITAINWNSGMPVGIVNYGIDSDYETTDKLLRTEIFKMIVSMKFKQYTFNEINIKVVRDGDGKVVSVTEEENNG